MSLEDDVLAIQQYFPQIYMACHVQHERGKSNTHHLSSRDATLLAHLSAEQYTSPSRLAKHLMVSQATISEAVANLMDLEFIHAQADDYDGRRLKLKLTTKGKQALGHSSVLDSDKLEQLLRSLTEAEKQQVLAGMRLLAQAAIKAAR